MTRIWYVVYKPDSSVQHVIDEIGLDYSVKRLGIIKDIPSDDLGDLVVADHPQAGDHHQDEVLAFARAHPSIPVIITRNEFPVELRRSSTQPNIYEIDRFYLVDKGIERLLRPAEPESRY